MNDLEKYFTNNNGRLIDKWMHYFEIYDRHFAKYRGTDVHIVEFGVSQGGSIEMWKDYFGPNCTIYGVDINQYCTRFEEENVKIFIGDQEDRAFLKNISQKIPRIDILIDDGGHTMNQQINTFEELFHEIEDDGVYLCEDLHTSYWSEFGGGYRNKGSFIEYSKNFIDYINSWYSKTKNLVVNDFAKSVHSLHYYDSVLVIEKRLMSEPVNQRAGKGQIPDYSPPEKRLIKRLKNKIRNVS